MAVAISVLGLFVVLVIGYGMIHLSDEFEYDYHSEL